MNTCCFFHLENGSPDLACGGDQPALNGIHLRNCSYLAGGDCSCGRGYNPIEEENAEAKYEYQLQMLSTYKVGD